VRIRLVSWSTPWSSSSVPFSELSSRFWMLCSVLAQEFICISEMFDWLPSPLIEPIRTNVLTLTTHNSVIINGLYFPFLIFQLAWQRTKVCTYVIGRAKSPSFNSKGLILESMQGFSVCYAIEIANFASSRRFARSCHISSADLLLTAASLSTSSIVQR
jgi:hypothetical protein